MPAASRIDAILDDDGRVGDEAAAHGQAEIRSRVCGPEENGLTDAGASR
jgi:hypothetical protein